MTTIRRIPTSKIDGNNSNATDTDEIRPYGEIAVYVGDNNKLELLMFDGVRTHLKSKVLNKGTFYGGDSDSGDGEGYDTIKLVPDEVLRRDGSDQYVIIDPTQPNHIHIRAGGTIDNSNAALILGGENSNVEIQAGENPPVYVRADNNTWMFDTDGSLTLPIGATNNGRISNINGISLAVDTSFWTFDAGGSLTFPDSTTQSTAYTGYHTGDMTGSVFADDSTLLVDGVNGKIVGEVDTLVGSIISLGSVNFDVENISARNQFGVNIGAGGFNNLIVLENEVRIQNVPFNVGSNDIILTRSGNEAGRITTSNSSIQIQAEVDFEIRVNQTFDRGTPEEETETALWSFESSGDLYFPDGTIQTTAYTGGIDSDPTQLLFEAGADEELISHSAGFVEGDPVFQIRLNTHLSGEAQTIWGFGTNGNLTLPKTTFSEEVTSGPAIVWPVEGAEGGGLVITDQGFLLVVEDKSWIFGLDGNLALPGNLVLPADGDILDSTGVSQTAQRTEGSWTVATGTATYSFTLPSDGTYTMWVKGNIPNGIIVWNATASVSNTNVPAIGTQYAWNYTGGGTPISLTSIPDQIRGVAGTISTDATYEGTTSNRFDFGISNTSGESQTVFYGYTKI
jgi:hypothetical protein